MSSLASSSHSLYYPHWNFLLNNIRSLQFSINGSGVFVKRGCHNSNSDYRLNYLGHLLCDIDDDLKSINRSHPNFKKAESEAFRKYLRHSLEMEAVNFKEDDPVWEGMMKATSYLNATAPNEMNLDILNKTHRILMAPVNPAIAGKIRKDHVRITSGGLRIAKPHFQNVPNLLTEFFTWYGSDNSQIHPVEFAAFVKFNLLGIHPYSDGNGRLSRLIFNHIINSHGYPYVFFPASEKEKYYNAITAFEKDNDVETYLEYVFQCVKQSVKTFLSDLK